jgi:hypothetical protein
MPIIVSGATNPSACNGTYNENGVYGGETRYTHESESFEIGYYAETAWIVTGKQ